MPMLKFTHVIVVILALMLAACGTVATPEWMGATEAALHDQDEENIDTVQTLQESEEVSTVTPDADVEPSVTPSPLPPTETPIPATEAPTAIPPTATATPIVIAAASSGDPIAGETLFRNGNGAAIACTTCHLPDQEMALVGPGMLGIGERAAERVPGLSASEYLHQSIVEPNAFVVPNYAPGLMPQTYAQTLTEEQIDDLVAYLLTL
ncbi:MAG: c-type cytochrome [Burkholderiales bacterium]|nr:c-type cytochrome [Anaerolineae bacterium]